MEHPEFREFYSKFMQNWDTAKNYYYVYENL